ncbi:hypothetical protein CBS101457_000749 [Exobasidium rhododendri]|nr:hypothetical protein CBS101457_000749 [Exobasidium rhododendri]
MATAAVGPPPGLSLPSSTDVPKSAPQNVKPKRSLEVKLAAPKENRYELHFMLALSSSPLVSPPDSMPALNEWYGDWEPYHFRSPHTTQSHGLPHSPMGSIGSGARAERFARGDHARERDRGYADSGEDGDSMGNFGGVMRDGGISSSNSRKETGGRYRNNRYDERDGEQMRVADAASRRLQTSGKNPFGQISASGTFKPAGKENPEGQEKRFNMGRMGRDRDMPPHAGGDDRRGGGARSGRERETVLPRDRRRGGYGEGEEEEEWESVPKSPENDRRNRAGHIADSASDWRRTSANKVGGKGSAPKDREIGRKTSFPAWMAEESEPSWMSEGQEENQFQLGGGSSAGRGGNSSRRMPVEEDINVDDVDVSGMDSIQAFKAQMRERERREKERSSLQGSSSTLSSGPPPGLAKLSDKEDQDSKRDGAAALQSAGLHQQSQSQEKSAAALFDNFASSAKQRQQEKQQQQSHNHHQSYHHDDDDEEEEHVLIKARDETGAQVEQEIVLPGRSSRFARFFDGKPQAAALAAQQRQMGQMEVTHRAATDQSSATSTVNVSAVASPKEGLQSNAGVSSVADLFKGMSMERPNAPSPSLETRETGGTKRNAPPGLQRKPSEADVQSMQKIMALLSGGGGGEAPKGRDDPHSGQQHQQQQQQQEYGRAGQAPPPAPSGINVGGPDGPVSSTPKSSHQSHSPAAQFQAQQQQQQQQTSQGNAWPTSPTQAFSPFLGSGQGQQQQHGGPPFRPPFPMDPRMLSRPPPQGLSPQVLPPHIAAALNGMSPMGRGMPNNFGMPPLPPGMRPPPPLPPQLQQHMMTLPPQAQHQLLMQHFQHHSSASSHFGNGPPQVQQQQQQLHHHATSPGQQHNGGQSPLPPFLAQSHASPSASQSAQLMALLGQGPGAGSAN